MRVQIYKSKVWLAFARNDQSFGSEVKGQDAWKERFTRASSQLVTTTLSITLGPGSRWKQVHFLVKLRVRVRHLSVRSIYSAPSPARSLSKRTLSATARSQTIGLDYAETQRRQGDALLRSDSSSPFTSREFLRLLSVHPVLHTWPGRSHRFAANLSTVLINQTEPLFCLFCRLVFLSLSFKSIYMRANLNFHHQTFFDIIKR